MLPITCSSWEWKAGGRCLCPQAAPGAVGQAKREASLQLQGRALSGVLQDKGKNRRHSDENESSGQRCQCESVPGKDLDWLEEGEEGRAQAVPSGNLSEQGRRREKTEPSLENLRLFIHSSVQQMLTTCQALC